MMRLLKLSPEVKEALCSLGPALPKPLISQNKLREMVDLPEDEQKMLVRSLLADKGVYPINL